MEKFLFFMVSMHALLLTACGNESADTGASRRDTPELITLAEQGEVSKINELLSMGKKTDVVDHCQWTPLMKAAQNGHIETVKLLLEHGAEIDRADKGNYTALLLAASRNHYSLVELLIQKGADINHQETTMGWSALIWATKLKHLETVEVLLKYHANRGLRDFKGNTALMWAKAIQSKAIIKILTDG